MIGKEFSLEGRDSLSVYSRYWETISLWDNTRKEGRHICISMSKDVSKLERMISASATIG